LGIRQTGANGNPSGGNQFEIITDASFSPNGLSHTVRYLHLAKGAHTDEYQFVAAGERILPHPSAVTAVAQVGMVIWRNGTVAENIFLPSFVQDAADRPPVFGPPALLG
jgi:hypothetical protein